jgi:autotransporter translocation and assembly factor TamB
VLVRGTISGKPLRPSGELTLTASAVALGGHQLGDLTVQALGREGEWTLNGTGFGKTLDLNATLRAMADYPYTLALGLRSLDFTRFASTDESLQAAISGEIDLRGALKTWTRPSGTVRIPQLQIRRGDYEVKARDPIRIDMTDGRLVITPFVLVAPSSQLRLSGEMASSGDVDLRADGAGNLMLLEVIGRPIHSARGQFSVSATVRHQPASGWALTGQAEIAGATVDLGLPVAFTDVDGRFTLGGGGIQIVNLDGKAGGGQFRFTGTVSLDDGPRVFWEVHEVALSTSQGLEAQISSTGQVQGAWQAITLSGEVEVLSALYDRNIELTDFLPFFREQILPAPRTKPATREVYLDIRVDAPGGMHLDNNVAEVELGAKVRVGGTVDSPQLAGTVEILTGEVKFKQRTFTITGGSIDFRGGTSINPVLNIAAESEISTAEADYTVTVTVSGTAEKPRVQLGADDPTLSETDILSLITFGQTVAQLQRQGGGISAIDAVALLPTGKITAPLVSALGVNRLEIEAVQSPASGAAGSIEPRVTIGKDLTDRFRATVSTMFGAGTQPMVQLEYRMTRRISLLGSWEGQTADQSGAFGGGFKFRYEFRKLPCSLAPSCGATAGPYAQ